MRLDAQNLEERARWLIRLRWVACAGVCVTAWAASAITGLVANPGALYAVVLGMAAYNLGFVAMCRRRPGRRVGRTHETAGR